ncbi:photosystem reaction center subunit H [Streptomyces fumigatiscleroticus]|nr:photosystem reaction center subunit H [Streptomyces fumigatiscleroticus]
MITREDITVLLDHPVYDGGGNKIGEAKHVYFDDVTGRPEWVSVKTGMFGGNESFVPIAEAVMVENHLEVPYAKDEVKNAPNVDVEGGGHLSEAEEHRLFDYYGIAWGGVLADDDTDRSAAGWTEGTGTVGAAGTAAAGTTPYREAGDRSAYGDDAMTRSEERMHIGVERRESGRARLRKYVVTEEVQQTVPLRHQEVRVEREPITEANRGAALSGPEISEAEHEVTLYEERPVVETEAVPVERVRLTTEELTEQETVSGRVRKEHIEAEVEEYDDPGRGIP